MVIVSAGVADDFTIANAKQAVDWIVKHIEVTSGTVIIIIG